MAGYVAWNKVTEVLPEEGKDYLVWDGHHMVVGNAQFYSEETILQYDEDIGTTLRKLKGRFIGDMEKFYFDDFKIYWAELPLAPGEKNPPYEEPQFDSKDIYLTKDGTIIGLHAIGHAMPYEYDLIGIDGSTTRKHSDFMTLEAWGNEYDNEHNMLGRGSFRLGGSDIEDEAKDFEAEGWVRCEAPKRKEK